MINSCLHPGSVAQPCAANAASKRNMGSLPLVPDLTVSGVSSGLAPSVIDSKPFASVSILKKLEVKSAIVRHFLYLVNPCFLQILVKLFDVAGAHGDHYGVVVAVELEPVGGVFDIR